MGELDEYQAIAAKLLSRTENGRVSWDAQLGGFTTTLQESPANSFKVNLSVNGTPREPSKTRKVFLSMFDSQGEELFTASSTDLPTNQAEEAMSETLERLYDAVRRQALKVPEKIKTVSDLLDRV